MADIIQILTTAHPTTLDLNDGALIREVNEKLRKYKIKGIPHTKKIKDNGDYL